MCDLTVPDLGRDQLLLCCREPGEDAGQEAGDVPGVGELRVVPEVESLAGAAGNSADLGGLPKLGVLDQNVAVLGVARDGGLPT